MSDEHRNAHFRSERSSGNRPAAWWPHPALSLLLGASWIALSHSLAPVHLITALLLAFLVPRALHGFLGPGGRIDWLAASALAVVVLRDIVAANLTVARLVLGPTGRLRPAWLEVPLACEHPRVNALFASIITMTPGTVSCVVDEARRVVWVHALHCEDASGAVLDMKTRYEAALLRVFRIDMKETA